MSDNAFCPRAVHRAGSADRHRSGFGMVRAPNRHLFRFWVAHVGGLQHGEYVITPRNPGRRLPRETRHKRTFDIPTRARKALCFINNC